VLSISKLLAYVHLHKSVLYTVVVHYRQVHPMALSREYLNCQLWACNLHHSLFCSKSKLLEAASPQYCSSCRWLAAASTSNNQLVSEAVHVVVPCQFFCIIYIIVNGGMFWQLGQFFSGKVGSLSNVKSMPYSNTCDRTCVIIRLITKSL
jgi:hypothetical protein